MIGVVTATAGGRAGAAALQAAWPEEVRLFTEQKAADALREAWRTCDAVVSFLAVGATAGRDLPITGRDLHGVHQAMEYLPPSNKVQQGDYDRSVIDASGEHGAWFRVAATQRLSSTGNLDCVYQVVIAA